MSLTRPDLDALPSYVPGRSVPGAIKLASNEVPYGPLPGVVEAIAEAAAGSHRYPDMGVVALREKLAARLGVDPQRVSTGCGSVALAEHLVRATTLGPQDEVRQIGSRVSTPRVDLDRLVRADRVDVPLHHIWIEAQFQEPRPAANAPTLPTPPPRLSCMALAHWSCWCGRCGRISGVSCGVRSA